MSCIKLSRGRVVLLLTAMAAMACAQVPPAKPVIDPAAEMVLQQLSDHMRQVKGVVFRVADTIDEVQADGRKLQFSHFREFTIMRPGKLKIVATGDVMNRTLWKDGKTLTVLDRDQNVYAQIPDPGTIEQAVDLLQEKYGTSLPAADLLCEDLYKTMTDGCTAIDYIGLCYAGEERCHHLAFTRENIDWQLWVSLGDKPSMKKLVITYKQWPGQPQYTLQLLKSERVSKIKDSAFVCEIPKGAEKIDIQPVNKAKE